MKNRLCKTVQNFLRQFKIRSLKFAGSFSHRISFFVLTYESHQIDPITVFELFNIPNGRG